MKKIIIIFISLILLGCGINTQKGKEFLNGSNSTGMTRDEYINSLDSAELQRNLVFWTSDTAFSTNADLLLLLDTLYQHVISVDFPYEVKKEEKWMSGYCSRLVSFYDDHTLGNDTLSQYFKADSVLNEGIRLMELGCQWTTMDMIVNNSTKFTFNRFREYEMLTQLVNSCENEKAKDLVYKEWTLYEQMLKKIGLISSNMVSLNYWGGSIAAPLRIVGYLSISQSRIDMYQTLLNIVSGTSWDYSGVNLENAERLLFDCCTTSLNRIIKESTDFYKEYEGKEKSDDFDKTIKETESTINELRPIVKEWIKLLDQLDDELTLDGNRHHVERAASYMLMKWAGIVTER